MAAHPEENPDNGNPDNKKLACEDDERIQITGVYRVPWSDNGLRNVPHVAHISGPNGS
jgi:hypothetical protein